MCTFKVLILSTVLPLVISKSPVFLTPIANVTVPAGREAVFICRVDKLEEFKVAWLRVDTQTILSISTHVVTKNERILVTQGDHQDWVLHIKDVRPADSGRYMCQINTEPMMSQTGFLKVVVPPDISASDSSGDIETVELGSIQMKCVATGYPEPSIVWRREDGAPLALNEKVKVSSWSGSWLNMTKVTRDQAGPILCIASNGVPPAVSKRLLINVLFKPVARVVVKKVDVYPGGEVTLECRVEGVPKPKIYWIRSSSQNLQYGEKYKTKTNFTRNKMTSILQISNATEYDGDIYRCVAKNDFGDSEASTKLLVLPVTTTTVRTTTTTKATTTTTTTTEKITTEAPTTTILPILKTLSVEAQEFKPKNSSQERKHHSNDIYHPATIRPDPWRRREPNSSGSSIFNTSHTNVYVSLQIIWILNLINIL